MVIFRSPTRVFPRICKDENNPPTDGSVALQLERGVLTAKLQLFSSEGRRNCNGSKRIENIPDPLVVELETTFPPH